MQGSAAIAKPYPCLQQGSSEHQEKAIENKTVRHKRLRKL